MGLKGQLEDLPLLDMLQIIAFSKKSGYLRVSGPPGRGAVMLREGRVLFSYSWSTVPKLRGLAADPSRITTEIIKECIEVSLRELGGLREGNFQFELTDSMGGEIGGVRIKPFLLEHGLDPQELLLDLAVDMDNERRETTSLLELAFRGSAMPEGADEDFGDDVSLEDELDIEETEVAADTASEPAAEAPAAAAAAAAPASEPEPEPEPAPEPEPVSVPASAEVGLPEERSEEPPADRAPVASGAERGHTVVLVDDERPVLEVVGRELARLGYRVHTAGSPRRGAELVRARLDAAEPVLVVVDLKMPTTSGRSFYGGFELVRKLQRFDGTTAVLLMVESLSEKAKARAKELGVRRVAYKPTLTKIDPELYRQDLKEFASAIDAQLTMLASGLGLASASASASASAGAAEASDSDGAAQSGAASSAGAPAAKNGATRMDFLANMTRKLVDPRGSEDVSRLLMEVAETFLERGVLFVVKGDLARGLTGFGVPEGQDGASSVKRVVVDIGSCHPMAEAVRTGSTFHVTSELSTLEGPIFAHMGRGAAGDGVLIPLLYNRATLLVLYGDNPRSGKPVGDLSGLELFMAQAGMALENKLLQQKLGAAASVTGQEKAADAGLSAS